MTFAIASLLGGLLGGEEKPQEAEKEEVDLESFAEKLNKYRLFVKERNAGGSSALGKLIEKALKNKTPEEKLANDLQAKIPKGDPATLLQEQLVPTSVKIDQGIFDAPREVGSIPTYNSVVALNKLIESIRNGNK